MKALSLIIQINRQETDGRSGQKLHVPYNAIAQGIKMLDLKKSKLLVKDKLNKPQNIEIIALLFKIV